LAAASRSSIAANRRVSCSIPHQLANHPPQAFVNTVVDSLKDTLVVTSVGGGPQVVPFLSVWTVLPASLLFFALYSAATQRLTRLQIFERIVGGFGAFFLIFGTVVFPLRESLHLAWLDALVAGTPAALALSAGRPTSAAALTAGPVPVALAGVLPGGLAGAVGMARNWTFSVFYAVSELWGDVVLSLLFWGLANETTSLADARVLYPVFGVGANVAQVAAGRYLRGSAVWCAARGIDWEGQVRLTLMVCAASCAAVLAVHRLVVARRRRRRAARRAANEQARREGRDSPSGSSASLSYEDMAADEADRAAAEAGEQSRSGEPSESSSSSGDETGGTPAGDDASKPPPPTLKEALAYVAASPQVRCLAVMSMSQGVCSSLLEFAWKSELRRLHPDPASFSAYLGDVATCTGAATVALMIVSPWLFSRVGWRGVASVNPRLLSTAGVAFLACAWLLRMAGPEATMMGGPLGWAAGHVAALVPLTPGTPAFAAALAAVVALGASVFVANRGARFSLFKPAEEMVYILLDEESRSKGKAAIDVVGSQAGKSASSLLQQALLVGSGGSMAAILPIAGAFQVAILAAWQTSVNQLSMLHKGDRERHEAEAAASGGDPRLGDPAAAQTLAESVDEGTGEGEVIGGAAAA